MNNDKGNSEDNKIRGTLENAEEAIRRMKEEI
jgi:SspJ family small acid-soluble spore protein